MARSHRYNKRGPLKGGGISFYRPDVQAQIFTPREARAEYARLRREANRRLEVLGRSEFANLQSVKNRAGGFAALARGADETEVRAKLYKVAQFLNLRTSSLQGAKRAQRAFIETAHEHGYDFVNRSNVDAFGRFMGAVQKHKEAKGYDSEQIMALYYVAREKNIDPATLADDFAFWLEHTPQLLAAPEAPSMISSEKFAERIGLTID